MFTLVRPDPHTAFSDKSGAALVQILNASVLILSKNHHGLTPKQCPYRHPRNIRNWNLIGKLMAGILRVLRPIVRVRSECL